MEELLTIDQVYGRQRAASQPAPDDDVIPLDAVYGASSAHAMVPPTALSGARAATISGFDMLGAGEPATGELEEFKQQRGMLPGQSVRDEEAEKQAFIRQQMNTVPQEAPYDSLYHEDSPGSVVARPERPPEPRQWPADQTDQLGFADRQAVRVAQWFKDLPEFALKAVGRTLMMDVGGMESGGRNPDEGIPNPWNERLTPTVEGFEEALPRTTGQRIADIPGSLLGFIGHIAMTGRTLPKTIPAPTRDAMAFEMASLGGGGAHGEGALMGLGLGALGAGGGKAFTDQAIRLGTESMGFMGLQKLTDRDAKVAEVLAQGAIPFGFLAYKLAVSKGAPRDPTMEAILKPGTEPKIDEALAKEKPSRKDMETLGIEGKMSGEERAQVVEAINQVRDEAPKLPDTFPKLETREGEGAAPAEPAKESLRWDKLTEADLTGLQERAKSLSEAMQAKAGAKVGTIRSIINRFREMVSFADKPMSPEEIAQAVEKTGDERLKTVANVIRKLPQWIRVRPLNVIESDRAGYANAANQEVGWMYTGKDSKTRALVHELGHHVFDSLPGGVRQPLVDMLSRYKLLDLYDGDNTAIRLMIRSYDRRPEAAAQELFAQAFEDWSRTFTELEPFRGRIKTPEEVKHVIKSLLGGVLETREGEGGVVERPSTTAPPAVSERPPVVTEAPPAETPKPEAEPAPVGRPEGATSARRAWMDEDAALLGIDELPTPARVTWEQNLSNAKARNLPEQAIRMAEEANSSRKPRVFDADETAGLVIKAAELKKAHAAAMERVNAASEAKDPAALKTSAAETSRIEEDFETLYKALRASGTEKGRNLAAQKLTIDQDFNLLSVLNRARAARGGELPLKEREALEDLVKRLSETNERLTDVLEREAPRPAEAAAEPEWLTNLSQKASEARARLSSKLGGSTLRTGLDPTILSDLAIIGGEKIARGAKSAVDFAKAMSKELGAEWDKVKRHATEIYASSRDLYTRSLLATREQTEQLKGERANLNESRQKTVQEGITKAVNRGSPLSEMGRQVQKLAEEFVRQGITEREPLIDAVHEALKPNFPELTRRQTMDAISGYGDFSPLNKDPVKAKLRDLKGQMQQIGKLEDMQAGKAPSKTGVERRTPSDEERALIQQVNEAKKKGGYVVTDPERQLRTAVQAGKTRLQNQIADLERQIKTKTLTVKKKGAVPTDPETEQLKVRRDELKAQFDDIFGRKQLTDAQKLEATIKATRKSIADLERRIDQKDLAPKQGTKGPESPELSALRKQRDALSKTLKDMREAAGVYDARRIDRSLAETQKQVDELTQHIEQGTLPEPKLAKKGTTSAALESLRAQRDALRRQLATSEPAVRGRLEKQITDLERRLAGKIEPPKKKGLLRPGKEIEKLEFQRDKLRLEIRRRIQAQKPRSIWQHIAEPFNLVRAIITSGEFSAVLRQGWYIVLPHPIRAAKSIVPMLKAFASEQAAWKIMKEIDERDNAPLYRRSKLYLSEIDAPLSAQEEAFMSRLAGKTPLVKRSARAYIVFLNKLRADSFDTMLATLAKGGEATAVEQHAIANFINVATGRGNLGSMEQASVLLNTVFFAPRYVASRFQLLAGQPLYRGTTRTRVLIAKEYARILIGMGLVYTLAKAAGLDVEEDPRSSDFGKIRIGNTRIDPLAGISQATVFMFRLITGETKRISGEIVPIRGEDVPYGGTTSSGVIGRFLRSKLAPVFGVGLDIMEAKNVVGEPMTPGSVAVSATTPITYRDIYDVIKEQGVEKGAALGLLAFFGMGLQTFQERKKKATKASSRSRSRSRVRSR